MRMWEIRENTGHYDGKSRMGYRKKSVDEAYECGYEDGYAAAIEEMKEKEDVEEISYRKRRY